MTAALVAPGVQTSLLEHAGQGVASSTRRGPLVGELFAGVGGFRLALEPLGWSFAWANQWEPGKRDQHAASIYRARFPRRAGELGLFCQDVSTVDWNAVREVDVLVGRFPCNDYSAAKPLIHSHGIEGSKGVLWWEVIRCVQALGPRVLILENVDRLLLSPAGARGNDFAQILASLRDEGYFVEWRVVNAADYGFPQKRRRVFIVAKRAPGIVGVFDEAFPAVKGKARAGQLPEDEAGLDAWTFDFEAAGWMAGGQIETCKIEPAREPVAPLGGVLERGVAGRYVIPEKERSRWAYLKGKKDEPRTSKSTGHEYRYKEGAMSFPDDPAAPGRTLLTNEGGTAASRTSHAVADPETGELRILTPREVERLQGFPDDWTLLDGVPERFRYFAMGNALVVGAVKRIGEAMMKKGVV